VLSHACVSQHGGAAICARGMAQRKIAGYEEAVGMPLFRGVS
jgi:hypothetical protein